ncbi:MAG TPA: hypothetical protein VJZ26_13600 [Blastocatellia bacterium]|nr:hypothetical protein [Blastocatellia bacterium]
MQASVNILTAAAVESFERDFMGEAEVLVRREGYSRAQHVFTVSGRTIGRLRWRGLRRAVYETEGLTLYIKVGALDKRIGITSEDGSESFLVERSRANPNRAGLRVEMAEGDNFRLLRSRESSMRSEFSIAISKQFYASTLMVFRFDGKRRTQTTARIDVKPVMKWEARFIHRLLALVVCRIILERRHSGAQPLRVKEKPPHFASGYSGRKRRRTW